MLKGTPTGAVRSVIYIYIYQWLTLTFNSSMHEFKNESLQNWKRKDNS